MKKNKWSIVFTLFLIATTIWLLEQIFYPYLSNTKHSPYLLIINGVLIACSAVALFLANYYSYLAIIESEDGEQIILLLEQKSAYLENRELLDKAKKAFTNYCTNLLAKSGDSESFDILVLHSLISLAGDAGLVPLRKSLIEGISERALARSYLKAKLERYDNKTDIEALDCTINFIEEALKYDNSPIGKITKKSFLEQFRIRVDELGSNESFRNFVALEKEEYRTNLKPKILT